MICAKPTGLEPGRQPLGGSTRTIGLFGLVGVVHLVGWGLFALYAPHYPAMAGLGALAYGLGLRHAFDADHISAIDDTTRFLLQKGRPPAAVGLFFSLGHSTVVVLMTVALVAATRTVQSALPELHSYGNIIGGSISGIFLWLIGILNLLVLLDILRIWRQVKGSGNYPDDRLNELLAQRGIARRLFGGKLQNFVNHSWQMYSVGMLFGLGFDTASEIALLGVAAGAAARAVPSAAIVSLALLFAAGMSLMDTADSVFMVRAYTWALSNPVRRIYYNIATTGLSVTIALLIGSIELVQVLGPALNLRGPVIEILTALDFERLGYIIVGLFVVGWLASVGLWKFRKLNEQSESAL